VITDYTQGLRFVIIYGMSGDRFPTGVHANDDDELELRPDQPDQARATAAIDEVSGAGRNCCRLVGVPRLIALPVAL
jgi:hypothetical protein